MCSSLGHKKNKQNMNSSIHIWDWEKMAQRQFRNLLCALKDLQLTPLSAKRRL